MPWTPAPSCEGREWPEAGVGEHAKKVGAWTSASLCAQAAPMKDGQARALSGRCHGQSWGVEADGDPPADVTLQALEGPVSYRLVFDDRSGRPARDGLGYFVYVPLG